MQQFRRANYHIALLHVVRYGQCPYTARSRGHHMVKTLRLAIGRSDIVLFTHATLGLVLSTAADLTVNISIRIVKITRHAHTV